MLSKLPSSLIGFTALRHNISRRGPIFLNRTIAHRCPKPDDYQWHQKLNQKYARPLDPLEKFVFNLYEESEADGRGERERESASSFGGEASGLYRWSGCVEAAWESCKSGELSRYPETDIRYTVTGSRIPPESFLHVAQENITLEYIPTADRTTNKRQSIIYYQTVSKIALSTQKQELHHNRSRFLNIRNLLVNIRNQVSTAQHSTGDPSSLFQPDQRPEESHTK